MIDLVRGATGRKDRRAASSAAAAAVACCGAKQGTDSSSIIAEMGGEFRVHFVLRLYDVLLLRCTEFQNSSIFGFCSVSALFLFRSDFFPTLSCLDKHW